MTFALIFNVSLSILTLVAVVGALAWIIATEDGVNAARKLRFRRSSAAAGRAPIGQAASVQR